MIRANLRQRLTANDFDVAIDLLGRGQPAGTRYYADLLAEGAPTGCWTRPAWRSSCEVPR